MIDGYGYIGQAGTGKTTQLIKRVEDSIDIDSWSKSSSVLAITFMHGSRRRLENQLKPIQRKGIRVCCQTIDSFCLNIFQRYKSYLGVNLTIIVSDNPNENITQESTIQIGINKIRENANQLLNFEIVREILGFSYPVVIVDEFQDCEGALLDVIKKLSECCGLFVAADDFQKLDDSPECVATEWLLQSIEVTNLEQIWRTNNSKILESAKALRTGIATKNGVQVNFAPSKDYAAYIILSNMQWYSKMGSNGKTIALISPVGPQRDKFVNETIERLNTPMEGKGKKPYKLGARPFLIESEKQTTSEDIYAKITDWDTIEVITLEILRDLSFEIHSGLEIAVKRAQRLMKLRNTNEISKIEFAGLISSGIHFANTFITQRRNTRIFLTVHGAKNREFDDVFILWPRYTLQSDELYLRKLMYNAITRAKRNVVIIVQGLESRNSEPALNLLS